VGASTGRHGRGHSWLPIKTVNLKHDLPTVLEALSRLDRELAVARAERISILKIIHGYGASGTGGDIRIAVQKRLHAMAEAGEITACIFGENWSKSDSASWRLLQATPNLKNDSDLGRGNKGVTIVWINTAGRSQRS
jgi:hypothetical protein